MNYEPTPEMEAGIKKMLEERKDLICKVISKEKIKNTAVKDSEYFKWLKKR